MRRMFLALIGVMLCGLVLMESAQAQYQVQPWPYQLQRFYYYPFYYFPHNYWPAMSPKYPEGPNEPYRKPPAYMAYPAFQEPGWRYENFAPQRYYRGFHFWLDQF